jgi:hypothetical protein
MPDTRDGPAPLACGAMKTSLRGHDGYGAAWSRGPLVALSLGVLGSATACGSDATGTGTSGVAGSPGEGDDNSCTPGDQDGIVGGNNLIELTVSDTGFGVGAPDSGSTESNITVQNLAMVTLVMTNIGTRPHDFVVQCMPTPNAKGCPTQSCFPAAANLPAVQPGKSATATFQTPATEGAYTFTSDEPGDTQTAADGGVTGLVGEFNLM